MHWIKKFFCFFILVLLIASCQEETNNSDLKGQAFFSVKNYFEQEINRIEQEKITVEKQITLDGKSETLQFSNIDFSKEFDVFINSDINKIAWLDKYQVDSTFIDEKLTNVSYTALDEDLRTKSLRISYQKGELTSLQIKNSANSSLATSEQLLNYTPQTGYRIENRQDITISGEQHLLVEGIYQK